MYIEYQDACKKHNEKVSAIAEHAWEQHQYNKL